MNNKEKIKQILEEHPTYSARKIGELIGLSRQTVNWYIRKLGIPRDREFLRKNNNTNRSFGVNISETAEQIIIGSILGDGSITKHKRFENSKLNLNSTLVIQHTEPQLEYLIYKKELLEDNGIRCQKISKLDKKVIETKYPSSINGRPIKANTRYTLRTRRCISFNKYRDLFYNNKKYINKYIYKLKDLGLAIWYMDNGFKHDNTYYLCTDCFSSKDLLLLQKVLYHNFSLETIIDNRNRIRIKSKSSKLFTSIIEKFVCDSMKYKINRRL